MHGERTTLPSAQISAPRAARMHLHAVWRYGLALAWAATLLGLLVPENMGYTLGKRPFWWDGVFVVVLAVGTVIVAVLKDWRWAPVASVVMSLVLVVLALPDLRENTGIAAKELAVAAGILLVSIGALSGWDSHGVTANGPLPSDSGQGTGSDGRQVGDG
jgi:hypothetical protein